MEYIGDELSLFAKAENWKKYWGTKVAPYLGESVLEVGAGIGTNMNKLIAVPSVRKWVCIEPDKELANQIVQPESSQKHLEVHATFLSEFSSENKFDSILYIDVIEHIEDEVSELRLAMNYLKPGGHLIILVPAYNYLYNEFDKAIGHFRRYDKKMLRASVPIGLTEKKVIFLDSTGYFASLFNKYFLKQAYPSPKQVKFWDSILVSFSKLSDIITFNLMGKSLIGIWQKSGQ